MLSKVFTFFHNILHAQQNARAIGPNSNANTRLMQQNVMLTKIINDIRVQDRLIASMVLNRDRAKAAKKKFSGIQKNIDALLLLRATERPATEKKDAAS